MQEHLTSTPTYEEMRLFFEELKEEIEYVKSVTIEIQKSISISEISALIEKFNRDITKSMQEVNEKLENFEHHANRLDLAIKEVHGSAQFVRAMFRSGKRG